ncbi:MAG: putative unusual protein kinase regulating ubiquinone biosynthesis (AarF/ABC1/UbiB family) [Paraglaciecola psychrophila]|jgi:predicted unusual protein kinase regulating ubiquinone biosynthesis (AarF/ABC1/UbiB family)
MAKDSLPRNAFVRSLSASIAGARAGGALFADKALNALVPGRDSNPLLAKEAKRMVAELGRLKGTYVKIGQMLAMLGEYILPDELTQALHSLESATEAMPWQQVEAALQQRLGDKLALLAVDQQPLGVASLGQVHRATIIASGEQICLKLLYPGVKETLETDFNSVVRMLKFTRWMKLSRDLDEWLVDIKQQLMLEVDYRREAAVMQKMALLLHSDTRYRVPKLYPDYCNDTIIAMEYMEGESVTSEPVAALSQNRRNAIASSMLDLFFLEVYQWQLMQSDPNFGNYLITIGESSDQLVLLDFGSVLSREPSFFSALGDTIAAAHSNNEPDIGKGLVELGCLKTDSADEAIAIFVEFCVEIMEPMRDPSTITKEHLNRDGDYRWSESKLMKRAALVANKSLFSKEFSLPSQQFSFVARKLIGVFTFISTLKAEFNGAPLLLEHLPSKQAKTDTSTEQ